MFNLDDLKACIQEYITVNSFSDFSSNSNHEHHEELGFTFDNEEFFDFGE